MDTLYNELRQKPKMPISSRSYNREITALEERASQMRDDGEHTRQFVDVINELAWELRNLDIPRSGSLAAEALSLSKEIRYEEGVANALLSRGVCRRNTSEYDVALEDLLQSRELFSRVGRANGVARATMWIGLVHQRTGNYTIALKYFLDALQIHEEQEDDISVAKCLTFIGRAYFDLQDYKNALDYFYRALRLRETLSGTMAEGTTFWDLGRTYLYLGNYEKALEYCERSLLIRQQTNDVRGLCGSMFLRGEIYGRLREAPPAVRSFWVSARLAVEIRDKWAEGKAWCSLGQVYGELYDSIYRKPRHYDDAEHYLFCALRVGQEINAQEVIIESHEQLYRFYHRVGQLEKALHHYREYQTMKEVMVTRQSKQALQNLIYGYEIEKAQKSAEIYRLKNVELAAVNRELARLNQEKNEFLAVVAHDLKNPLAGISIAVSLIYEHRRNMTDEQLNDQLRVVLRTAESMKDLVTKLLDINALETGKINLNIETLFLAPVVRDLVEEYQSRLNAKNLGIVCLLDDRLTLASDRHCIREILDNLLSNAIKFSLPGRRVFIRADATQNETSISIRDEGPGIPDTDFSMLFTKFSRLSAKPTGGESSTGLGLSIVKKLTELLGGRIRCDSIVGKGTTFTVVIPTTGSATPALLRSNKR